MLENLKNNKNLLKKGKKFKNYYYLIESPVKINIDIKIEDFACFYQIDHSKHQSSENEYNEQAIKALNKFKNREENTYSYILRIKIVDLIQKKVEHPITKLAQVVDPEIGIGISPSNICKDLTNLFSLYFGSWFKIVPYFLYWEEKESSSLISSEFKEIMNTREGNDLTLNYNSITELRDEQFYLIQKSLSRFNQSLKSVDDDFELGLVLLVSTIENISRKYGDVDEKFDENIEFYHRLKKIFNNITQHIENSTLEDLFEKIGEVYLNLSHLRTKAKYKNFCLNFISPHILNEKFEEMISNLYDLRSKILHAGENLGYHSRDQMILFNPRTKSGKIKKYKDKKGKYLIILRLPSYNDLLKIFADIIINFIRYIYSVKDDEEDKALYNESDIKKRNIIMGSISKDGFKPGYVVNFNTDFYRKIDFIDLTQIQNKLKAIERNSEKVDSEESLHKVEEILQHPYFSLSYLSFRKVCYFKIFFLHSLKKYKESLEMFEKYSINEINNETIPTFNIKAYCLVKLSKFKEAHILIDEILEKVENDDEAKANYLDSKGDFYKIEGNYKKAIEFYEKSLLLKRDPPLLFHKETERKLNECLKELKRVS